LFGFLLFFIVSGMIMCVVIISIDPEFEDIMITEITPERVQIMSLKNYETSYIKRDKIPKNIKIEVKKEYRAIRREDKLEIWWDYGY
ncbi:MAG: hypothetical protein J7J21_03125, partial [Methanomicrobia archaeon]|nr:hypothetical protein [Methanomicrobia archaeon]